MRSPKSLIVALERGTLAPAKVGAVDGDPVSQEVARIVADLPGGVYRTHVSICRVEFGSNGLEKGTRLVSDYAFDFESRPRALSAPPFDFGGTCEVCGELVAGTGQRHKACDEGSADDGS
jgi:hypothetical protein